MEVTVVIAAFAIDRLNDVLDCISSLRRQTFKVSQIILALDPVKSLIGFYKSKVPPYVDIVKSNKIGLSDARNAGIKEARGDIVAFIDDDAFADEKWVENLVRNYDDPNVMGVGGFIRPVWQTQRPKWFPEELDWIIGCSYKGLPDKKTTIRNPIGCNMSFRKEVFKVAGYFDTKTGRVGNLLMGHEDTEFAIRLYEEMPNRKILYDPEAVVNHRVAKTRTSLKYIARRSYSEGFSKALLASAKSDSRNMLYVEKDYLRDLLIGGVLDRLLRAEDLSCLLQAFALILSSSLVLLGYVTGKFTFQNT